MRVVGPNCLGADRRRGTRASPPSRSRSKSAFPAAGPGRHRLAERQPRQLHDAPGGRARAGHQPLAHHRQRMRRRHRGRHRFAGAATRPPQVILCCMETCRDGGKLRAAMAMARDAGKPLVVLKVGVSDSRQRGGGLAHRRARRLGCGVRCGAAQRRRMRVPSIEQLLDVGHALGRARHRPRLPHGRAASRWSTASGGFGILMADAASAQGLAPAALVRRHAAGASWPPCPTRRPATRWT